MSLAQLTTGLELLMGDGAGTETFRRVPEVTNLSRVLLVPDRGTVDVSSFDTAEGSVDILTDGSVSFTDVTFDINLVIGNPIHEDLIAAAQTGALTNFKIREPGPNGKTQPFSAYVTDGGGNDAKPKSPLKQTWKLKVTNIGTRA